MVLFEISRDGVVSHQACDKAFCDDEHEHDDFDSVELTLPEVADVEALVAAVKRLAREQDVLRVKGYVAVSAKPMRLLLQAVGERVRRQYDRPWGAAPRVTQLVVIAEHDRLDPAKVRAVLDAALVEPAPTLAPAHTLAPAQG